MLSPILITKCPAPLRSHEYTLTQDRLNAARLRLTVPRSVRVKENITRVAKIDRLGSIRREFDNRDSPPGKVAPR